jgi:hypothetical protein
MVIRGFVKVVVKTHKPKTIKKEINMKFGVKYTIAVYALGIATGVFITLVIT